MNADKIFCPDRDRLLGMYTEATLHVVNALNSHLISVIRGATDPLIDEKLVEAVLVQRTRAASAYLRHVQEHGCR